MASKGLLVALVLLTGLAAHGAAVATVLFRISGNVPCSNQNSINAETPPPFSNATVQLMSGDKVVASTTTDMKGNFNMSISLPMSEVEPMLRVGKMVVVTPLNACNADFAGIDKQLTAPLQLVQSSGNILGGVLGLIIALLNGIVSVIPGSFS